MIEPITQISGEQALKSQPVFDSWLEAAEVKPDVPATTAAFLETVFILSPFLKDCAFKESGFLVQVLEHGFEKALEQLLTETREIGIAAESEDEVMRGLRMRKRQAALLCGLADLGGWWQDEQVTQTLTKFAEVSLSAAFDHILRKQHESGKIELSDPENPQNGCGFVVLGMGKLGAGELNYSSDIDLIVFFDEMAPVKIHHDDPITLLNRIGKQLIKIMQERTEDGYVFRTDLRLRPDPSSTPLIIPVETALHYYESQGQNWERSAMIKARPVAGDVAAADQFLQYLTPFVWRKYLDFNAINDVQSIKRQIHAHKGHGEIAIYGHNIKLGRGGIREIEFFAQTQQLIAGGRNMKLRTRETVASLDALVDAGWIKAKTRTELTEAYWYLRALEHRLQMVRDEQTHSLPETAEELQVIANLSGEPSLKKFEKKIRSTLECVERHYAVLFEQAEDLSSPCGNLVFTGGDVDPGTVETLEGLGYDQPLEVIKTVKTWHTARVPALRTTQARELLTELVPHLLETFSRTDNPAAVFYAFDRFLSGLPAGIQLFSLLKNNQQLTDLLVRILDTAPRLAEQIARKPHVFDAMLEPESTDHFSSKDRLDVVVSSTLDRVEAYEQFLDAARQFAAEARFHIGTRLFSGELGWQEAALDFSNLADAMVAASYQRVAAEFESQHGKVKGARVCILAMGRLGSRELTSASDLDLIFLYDVPDDAEQSDGKRPLDITLYFIRLLQRFIAAMTAPTAEGVLYPLDFRLRPSGNAGPLATTVESFFKYQENEAWVWEAQALTRARPVYGDAALCDEVSRKIASVIPGVAERHELKPEVRKMRDLIDKEKGDNSPWNVKLVPGGLLDVEFVAQWLVLQHPAQFVGRTSTFEILDTADAKEILGERAGQLANAFSLYSLVLQLERCCLGEQLSADNLPMGFQRVLCQRLDAPTIDACEAQLKEFQTATREIFNELFPAK